MKFHSLPWLCMLALMALSFWVRTHLIENSELGFFCTNSGHTLACNARWLFMLFILYKGPSFLVLFLGLLATLTRSSLAGFLAGAIGIMALVVYAREYAAVGFLLGVLMLARAQFEERREQHGAG
jgi:hypothetical protein